MVVLFLSIDTITNNGKRQLLAMKKNDEVSVAVRHEDRSQFINMPNIKLTDIEKQQLEKLGNTVSRTDCILIKK